MMYNDVSLTQKQEKVKEDVLQSLLQVRDHVHFIPFTFFEVTQWAIKVFDNLARN